MVSSIPSRRDAAAPGWSVSSQVASAFRAARASAGVSLAQAASRRRCTTGWVDYRPQPADLPDARLWRIDTAADYGALFSALRGRIDLGRIRSQRPEILRLVASVHTGAVSAHDVLRMLARGGALTALGDALAHYGRIFKTLHILSYVDEEPYRRQIKGIRNLQEGRHDLARRLFHGGKGELAQSYQDGMEDQLGALGLLLNCIALWNTVYIDLALARLRARSW